MSDHHKLYTGVECCRDEEDHWGMRTTQHAHWSFFTGNLQSHPEILLKLWQDSQGDKTGKDSTDHMRFCYHSRGSGSLGAKAWGDGRRYRILCAAQCSRLETSVQQLCLTLLVSFSLTFVWLTQMHWGPLLYNNFQVRNLGWLTSLSMVPIAPVFWPAAGLLGLLHRRLPFLNTPLGG